VVAWYFVVPRFGIKGVLAAWLVAELVQVLYIMGLNHKFFAHHQALDVKYPVRLTLLSLLCLAGSQWLLPHSEYLSLIVQGGIAVASGVAILGLDIPLFELIPVWSRLRVRLQQRMARVT